MSTDSSTPSSSKAARGTALLYAESHDGVGWSKPNLGLVEWKGSKDNNLLMLDNEGSANGGMTTGVYLDEEARADARYKIVTGSNRRGLVAQSADGLRWNETKDLQAQTHARWDTPKNISPATLLFLGEDFAVVCGRVRREDLSQKVPALAQLLLAHILHQLVVILHHVQ